MKSYKTSRERQVEGEGGAVNSFALLFKPRHEGYG